MIQTNNPPFNYAKLVIPSGKTKATGEVLLQRGGEINWINIKTDKEGGKFKIRGIDQKGGELFNKDYVGNTTKRYGERLSLPITDSRCIIEVQSLENGPSSFEVFID